jgi:hypothetical protein
MSVIDLADIRWHFSLKFAYNEGIHNHSGNVCVEVRTGTCVHRVAAVEELAHISAYVLLNNKLATRMIEFELLHINYVIIKQAKLFTTTQSLVEFHS